MTNLIRQFSAGVVTFYKQENQILYLILHYTSGHWDFPKGKMENGETSEITAHRELKEETNLKATLIPGFKEKFEYFFKYPENKLIKKEVTFFLGETTSQDVKLSPEHIDFKWLPLNQALMQLTYDNAKKLLKNADKFLTSKTRTQL
ncbi:MAG: NUDIX hydrolase [candidate division TM6 bacterium GW2011_GWF2_32_72]|nr:MAG: NUDIX hydrolase [candidate division TM6 bacterium GW2011_GWF2_32_72]